ncbi:MAG: ArdC-like ssDNA-binding domain-containing protein, partial [Lacipirellulaceae bacterium]
AVEQTNPTPPETSQQQWKGTESLPKANRWKEKQQTKTASEPDSQRAKKQDVATVLTEKSLAKLNDALSRGQSETLTKYLAFTAKFHNYSLRNCLLIAAQKPDATHVAGYQKWKQLGRQVKRGEKAITIVQPRFSKREAEVVNQAGNTETKEVKKLSGFGHAKVFDISQTEGDAVPEFATISGDPGESLSKLEQLVMDNDITLSYETPPSPGAIGLSSGGHIYVTPGLSDAETFSVLAHELAHELIHKGERRHETTPTVRETEAEAVAFVVSEAAGLNSTERSSDYISLYRGDPEVLSESLKFIQKTAGYIIKGITEE